MMSGRRRKRSRKQTEFFNPEKQRGLDRSEKKGNKTPPPNKKCRSAEVPSSSDRSGSSDEPEARKGVKSRRRRSTGSSEGRKTKCRLEDLDTTICAERGSLESDSESDIDDGEVHLGRAGSPQNMLVEAIKNGVGDDNEGGRKVSRHRRKQHHAGCGSISQVMGEDIICDAGFVFLPTSFDSDDEIDRDTMLHKYADIPGVRCHQPPAKKSRRNRGTNASSNASSLNGGANQIQFRSRRTYEGASINLGSHPSSAAAAAMQDLANLALLGSDHIKTMHVLSKDEAWVGLRAAKLPTALPSFGRVDTFRSQFTEEYKFVFEHQIEEALASIGGQDDILAEVISTLDVEAYRHAEMLDAAEEAKRAKTKKKKEKQRAREARRAKHLGLKLGNPRKKLDTPSNVNSSMFRGEHGIYGVDDEGRYFWLQGVRKTQQTPDGRKTTGRVRGALETDSDMSLNSDGSYASSAKARYSTTPADLEVPDAGSKTSSRASSEDLPSPASFEQRKGGRVRILSFDSCSSSSSVDNASETKDMSMEVLQKEKASLTLQDVFSPEEVQDTASSSLGNALKQNSAVAFHRNSTEASEPQQVSFVSSIRIFEPDEENNTPVSIHESRTTGESKELQSSEASCIPDAIAVTEVGSGHLPPFLVSAESYGSEKVQSIDANRNDSGRCDNAMKQNVADTNNHLTDKEDANPLRSFLPKDGEEDVADNERLRPALEILQNFTITPLLSPQSPGGGVKVAGSDAPGKVLTGLKFKSKMIGQPNASQAMDLTDEEFVIDVRVGEGNVPILKLRTESTVASETLTTNDTNLVVRIDSTMMNGER